MNDRFVFDLDNTLIMTDGLNNASYNYALTQLEIPPIPVFMRITRDVVFCKYPKLTEVQKNQIVALKQNYFMENLHFTQPNTNIISFLKSNKPAYNILWTRADKNRVNGLLMHYGLKKHFTTIVYSNKRKLSEDIVKICNIFDCDPKQLLFLDDDLNIVNEIKLLGQRVL